MMASKKDMTAYAMDHTTRDFLQRLADSDDKPLSQTPIEQTRAEQLRALKDNPPKVLNADVEDLLVPGGSDADVSIRIVRPKNNSTLLPAVIYLHGGGWVICGKETHDRMIRAIANGANAAIVFVNYSYAPQAQYPVQNQQAYKVLQWVAAQGHAHGLDPEKIAVAGDSVGGNMAAAITLMSKSEQGPNIACQLLLCPTLDAQISSPSYAEFATGFMLTRESMQWCWQQYAPDPTIQRLPTVSPLQASQTELQGLPPTLIITAECDILRDEGEAYAAKLSTAGVEVVATRYLGTIHNFMASMALGETKAAKTAICQANSMLSYYLR